MVIVQNLQKQDAATAEGSGLTDLRDGIHASCGTAPDIHLLDARAIELPAGTVSFSYVLTSTTAILGHW